MLVAGSMLVQFMAEVLHLGCAPEAPGRLDKTVGGWAPPETLDSAAQGITILTNPQVCCCCWSGTAL